MVHHQGRETSGASPRFQHFSLQRRYPAHLFILQSRPATPEPRPPSDRMHPITRRRIGMQTHHKNNESSKLHRRDIQQLTTTEGQTRGETSNNPHWLAPPPEHLLPLLPRPPPPFRRLLHRRGGAWRGRMEKEEETLVKTPEKRCIIALHIYRLYTYI